MADPYRVVGSLGSPYSMKMRAIVRYRRLPHIWQLRDAAIRTETAQVRPQLVPMVRFPDDGIWRVDSTPIAYELEQRHGERSILPDDRAHRFLSDLIEDMADEWLTKAMFHYRWYYAADRRFASWWIATDQLSASAVARDEREAFAREFNDRQVSRMAMVGCTEENRPVIEESYARILSALEPCVGQQAFLFGTRPSLADFGLFGQLKTLADDPTPRNEMIERAPTVLHWVRQLDDLSGIEGTWQADESQLSPAVEGLLQVAGDSYLPFLAANAAASETGAEEVRLTIRDKPFAQPPFRYQVKCYSRLKSLYARLDGAAKQRADAALEPAGCLRWLRA